MLYIESQEFFDKEVLGRYGEWKPTDMETSDWVDTLQKFPRETALAGLRQFYASPSGGYKTPKLGKIIGICQAHRQKAGDDGPRIDSEPVLLFTLKCVEQPVWGGRVGMVQRFFASSPKKVPGDKTKIRLCAEDMVEKFVKLYGGAWEIIRDWDAEELPF